MAGISTDKVCRLCGESCAGSARVRDQHGQYYHRTCLERAAEEKRAARAQQAVVDHESQTVDVPKPAAPENGARHGRTNDDVVTPFDTLTKPPTPPRRNGNGKSNGNGAPLAFRPKANGTNGTNGAHGASAKPKTKPKAKPPKAKAKIEPKPAPQKKELAPPAPAKPPAPVTALVLPSPEQDAGPAFRPCDACGATMPAVAMVCQRCGCELAPAPEQSSRGGPRERVWPTVFGTVSLTLGAGGLLLYGPLLVVLVVDAARNATWSAQAVPLTFAAMAAGLSFWLSRNAIGLYRRRRATLSGIRWWAVAKLALVAAAGTWFWLTRPFGDGTVVIAVFAATLIALVYWPIFILAWCRRKSVRRERFSWN